MGSVISFIDWYLHRIEVMILLACACVRACLLVCVRVLIYCHLLSARLNGEDSLSTDVMKTLARQLERYMYAITTIELFLN